MESALPIHHSEQIHWASYDPETQMLKLTLNDRQKHGYTVPAPVVRQFVKSTSHGQFFHKNIRNNPNYRYHGKVD